MNSTDSRKFEEEVLDGLDVDDVEILTQRYNAYRDFVKKHRDRPDKYLYHSRSQWTRIHDAVQEHFSSHVLINNSSHKLPANIYALKQFSKRKFGLAKKRDCERRARQRDKLMKAKALEQDGNPVNFLLSMVDPCEVCKKLFVTVNLFWGITLCDLCYFNEEVIKDIMSRQVKNLQDDQNNSFQIIERVMAKPSTNDRFFSLPNQETRPPTPETPPSGSSFVSPEVESFNLPSPIEINIEPPEPDIRPISTYTGPSVNSEESEEEVIHEEGSQEDPLQFEGYFSQVPFMHEDKFISD